MDITIDGIVFVGNGKKYNITYKKFSMYLSTYLVTKLQFPLVNCIIYIIITQLLFNCVFVCPDCIKTMWEYELHL